MSQSLSVDRRDAAVESATTAFWAAVAANLPEVRTGDVDPFQVEEFRSFAADQVEQWYENNAPDDGIDHDEAEAQAVDRLGELVGHPEGCAYTLKATTAEIALHLALVLANDGEWLEACGDPR